ncbi:hypothetical protein HDU96_007064 [Phlyctochytrium bullatum]|nr:hypothetical protein HDU96_007064 [Phlyctochytrium bullatum]
MSIPAIAPWSGQALGFHQIQVDASAGLSLQPTQSFRFIDAANSSVAITASLDSNKTLCVELTRSTGYASFQECRNGHPEQQFVFANSTANLFGDEKCVGRNDRNQIVATTCEGDAATAKTLEVTEPRELPRVTKVPLQFEGTDSCLQAFNASATEGDVKVVKCDGSPSQAWYWLWGQLRNVETGLCVDAPDSEYDATTSFPVVLRHCAGMEPTQRWTTTGDRRLLNGGLPNCLRKTAEDQIVLGTNLCSDADTVQGPNVFTSAVSAFVADLGSPECTTPRHRKDFRDLTPEEQQSFFTGLKILGATPSLMGRKSRYLDFVSLHGSGANWFHTSPYFLPWHRYFTAMIERDLQTVLGNASFAYPYWAWGADADTWFLPETGVLAPGKFGTSGLGQENACVIDDFANGTWAVPNPERSPCLIRGYDKERNDFSVSQYTEDFMLLSLQVNPISGENYTDYDSFRDALENLPHNNFHQSITGENLNSHMGIVRYSVTDPIFFMHHNNIDRHWQYFQNANPSLAKSFNGVYWNGIEEVPVSIDDLLIGFNVPVSKAIGVRSGAFCHSYQPYSKSMAAVVVQQSQLARRNHVVRRQSASGNDLLASLDPAVAGKVIQDEIAIKSGTAAPVDKSKLPTPRRVEPSRLSDEFLDQMKQWMPRFNKEKIRRMEDAARKTLAKLRSTTDKVLKEKFGKEVGNATFEQNAVAVKVAIAEMVLKKA